MASDLELSWADGGADLAWVPGLRVPLRVRLTNHAVATRDLVQIEEPSGHLAFSIAPEGAPPRWYAGRDFMRMAGDPTHEGIAVPGRLASGASWEAAHALDRYADPPPAGRYAVRARYRAGEDVVAETPDRVVTVVDAGLAAAASAHVESSGSYLVHAVGAADALWLRVADSVTPHGAAYCHRACAWPGRGRVAVAQHAFSPLSDPPLEAFRYWALWQDGARGGGARVDYRGTVEAAFDEALPVGDGARMLEPVQFLDGSLRVPLFEDGSPPRVTWLHVTPDGRASVAGTQDLPGGAQHPRVAAFANGMVAVLWVERSGLALLGQGARTGPAATAPTELARFDAGEIVWFDAVDGRGGVTALVVRQELAPGVQYLHVHRASPSGVGHEGSAAWDEGLARELRVTDVPQNSPALALLDAQGRVRVSVLDGGPWRTADGVKGTLGFGLTAGTYVVTAWGADAAEGLRFGPA